MKILENTNWAAMGLYEIKSISELFKLFMNTILHYFHISFPLEKKKNEIHGLHGVEKNDINIRDELYMQKKRSPTPENIKKYKNTNLSKQRKAENMNNLNYTRMI